MPIRFFTDRPAWMKRAACRGMPIALWFPESNNPAAFNKAKQICAECPVRDECREYGKEEKHGMWGGKSRRPRRGTNEARRRQTLKYQREQEAS